MAKINPKEQNISVKLNQAAPCQQRLKASLPPKDVVPVKEEVLREFKKEANLPGFRKGRAPEGLVEQKYSSEIREETIKRLLHQLLEKASKQHNLKPVGPFEVTKLDFDESKGLDVEANVEVEPEFKLASYRGIRVQANESGVSPEEVDKAINQLQEQAAQLVPSKEGEPKEKKLPSLDDEFAKDMGFDSMGEMRKHLESKIKEKKQSEEKQFIEQSICDELLKRNNFEVPPSLVSNQTERLTREFEARLLISGLSEDKAKEELAKYTDKLRTNAVRMVKLAFVLERIAAEEKLSVTQDELIDRLWKLAKSWRKDPLEVRKLLDAKGLWPSVLSSIRQDKTIEFLIGVSSINGKAKEPNQKEAA